MGSRESVAVGVLGRFEVRVGDRPAEVPPGRQSILLAALAMSAGRAVSVDRLAEAVWGDDDLPANARRAIQTYVTRLRQVLGPESIETEPAGYVLRTAPDRVDALRFRRLVERSGREPEVERELLAEALRLWRGEAFEDVESDSLRAGEGRSLSEQRLTATERRIDLNLADGRAGEVVSQLKDLVARHPLREPLWTRLMVALATTGRQAEALEQYEVVRARIADELGVDPGGELQRTFAQVLEGTTPQSSVAATTPARSVPRQLPADIGTFSGRATALATLDALVDGSHHGARPAVAAVYGTGGVGKTTLVLHWAHRVAPRFPDGQLYLNLRGYGPGTPMSPAAALEVLLRGLGVDVEQIPAEVDGRANLLRSRLADREVLLVLDNARDVEQVRPLLPGSGGTVVVVTSRSQLRGLVARESAQRVSLEALPAAESREMLAGAMAVRGVRHDPAELAELAERCGHLPLALSIAAERASRQPDVGLPDLIDELRVEQERLDALDVGDESTDLRAVIAWSYRALDHDTARAFRLLGLHPGPDLGRPAAAALTGTTHSQARRLLDRLVDTSLLEQRRLGRYELHDLLRTYAAELVEQLDPPDDRDAALRRLFGWYMGSAYNASQAVQPTRPMVDISESDRVVTSMAFEGPEQAFDWFASERQALVAAVHDAAARGWDRVTYQIVLRLSVYLGQSRALVELAELLALARAAAGAAGDRVAAAQSAHILGLTQTHLLDDESACAQYEAAAEEFAQVRHERGHSLALTGLGQAHQTFGRPAEAVGQYERALGMQRRLGDPQDQSVTLNNLAMALIDLGRYEDATVACREALGIARSHGPARDEADFLDTLGRCYLAQGRAAAAIDALEAAVRVARSLRDRWEEGVLLVSLGQALRADGQLAPARDAWRRALAIYDEIGASDGPGFVRAELVTRLASVESDVDESRSVPSKPSAPS